MSKTIIWDLCGGSQNSVYKAIGDDPSYKIYTLDILDKQYHKNQIQVDLTREDIIDWLENNLPKPDIILASPNCAAFSVINNVGEKERIGLTRDFQVRDLADIQRIIDTNLFFKYRKAEKERETAIVGLALANNTAKIINHFKPKFWYIENPHSSRIWAYLDDKINGHKNLALYNNYDSDFSPKPTYFLSNKKLELKKEKLDNSKFQRKCSRSQTYVIHRRNKESGTNVMIPKELIKDIISQFGV